MKQCYGKYVASFIELSRAFDDVVSIPIRSQEQRIAIKARILKLKARKEVVECFRDSPGYLMIAYRRKRLPDYFES
jgi:hypothetical protein